MNLESLYKYFYRFQYFRFIRTAYHLSHAVTVSILANAVIFLLLFISYANPLEPQYFSTSFNGKTGRLVAINEPNTSDYAILQWANTTIISAFSYDFYNYKTELQQVSQFFTEDGWSAFISAIQASNNLDQVVAKKLIVNAVATSPPIILQKGELNGVYSWRIQMPVLVTYQAASGFNPQNLIITILVTRISTLDSYKGIGIQQFISSDYDITSVNSISNT